MNALRVLPDSLRVLEETGGDGSEDKSTDVRQVSDSSGLYLRDRPCMNELGEKPEANQECCWNHGDARENKKEQNGFDLVAGISHDESAHHRSDCATCPKVWNRGMGIKSDLGEHCNQTASEIKGEVSRTAHGIFDLGGKGPQENHVADDVGPAAVHEHGSEDRDPSMAGSDLCRDGGPLRDERVAAGQLKQKNADVDDNDEGGNDWHLRRAS